MNKLHKILHKNVFELLVSIFLMIVVLVLFYKNYVPGTYLTGWDNLHTEFNFYENIVNRSIFGVWQEYQGTGILTGNAHTADLLRQIFLFMLSVVLPSSILRYFYHFLMLYIGGLGVYFLSRKVFENRPASLLSSLIYILNPGTMQYFYVPYEAFSHFFAFLPWLVLALFNFLEDGSKKNKRIWLLINALATPSFYIPTLFVVYMTVFLLITTIALIWTKLKDYKQPIFALSSVLAINAFWLIPFIIFTLRGTEVYTNSLINRSFTEEAFLRNQKFGNINDIISFKGFLFDTTDVIGNTDQHSFMLNQWNLFLNQPFVFWFYFGLFIVVLASIVFTFLGYRNYKSLTFSFLFLLGFFALMSDNPPFGFIFKIFQEHLPFFKQIFRFSFTKFIAIYVLSYAVLIGYSVNLMFSILKNKLYIFIALLTISFAIFYFNIPSFKGYFIYPEMRKSIPQEYFKVFDFFNNLDDYGKVANFPQPTFWGWVNYDWGYRGSGFPWYGIKQPIMDRAFDVWNPYTENYYREVSHALYTKDYPLFDKVLKKYAVKYIWVDARLSVPHNNASLAYENIEQALNSLDYNLIYSEDGQKVYENKNINGVYGGVIKGENVVLPSRKTSIDSIYSNFGDYITDKLVPGSIFPFQNIDDSTKGRVNVQKRSGIFYTEYILENTGTLYFKPFPYSSKLVAEFDGKTVSLQKVAPKLLLNSSELSYETGGASFGIPITSTGLVPVINKQALSINVPVMIEHTNALYVQYFEKNSSSFDITKSLFDLKINDCGFFPNEKTRYFSTFSDDQGVLLGGNSSVSCKYARLIDIAPELNGVFRNQSSNYVISLSFKYSSSDNTSFRVCLTKEGDFECTYQYNSTLNLFPISDKTVTWNQYVDNTTLDKLWLKVEVDSSSSSREKYITIKDLTLSLSTSSDLFTDVDFTKDTVIDKNTILKSGDILSLTLADESAPSFTIDAYDSLSGSKCYGLGSNDFDITKESDVEVGNFVRISSNNSNVCSYFPIPSGLQETGFLLEITHKNVEGRPLRLGVKTAPSEYYFFREILDKSKSWTKSYYIVSARSGLSNEKAYLELDNYAVGKEKRINDLQEIRFYPITSKSSENIVILNGLDSLENQVGTVVSDIRRVNPFLYRYTLQDTNPFSNVLTLNQSFDKGWVLVSNGKLHSPILVNGWANGWYLDGIAPSGYILYFPQIIVYIAVVLIVIGGFLIIVAKKYSSSHP